MTLADAIRKRGVQEVLHFTTHRGLAGIVAAGKVLSRKRLPQEDYLEYVFRYNCLDRSRDKLWWDYVNLSITRVNDYLLRISAGKWHAHEDGWWCILSFSTEILLHKGVYFTTTNNAYDSVQRGCGLEGFEAMFAKKIQQFSNKFITRTAGMLPSQPTCPQAEVLYPGQIDIKYACAMYLPNEETAAKAETVCEMLEGKLTCEVREDMFPEELQ